MNNVFKNSIWGIAAAIAIGFATYGSKIVEALHAAWLFMLTLSDEAPLGLTSFAISVTISVLAQLFLRRHWPKSSTAASRSMWVDSIGVVLGGAVMYVLLPTTQGMLLGIMAGFVAPWVSRIASLVAGTAVHALRSKSAEVDQ